MPRKLNSRTGGFLKSAGVSVNIKKNQRKSRPPIRYRGYRQQSETNHNFVAICNSQGVDRTWMIITIATSIEWQN
jgi:hypothetical protein